jgi:two-component system chemotaxis response regulator CheB
VTLDIEMPEMNGIEVLETLKNKGLDTAVVVVSSLTARGGELTMRALELGAFDFITKPEGGERGIEDFNRTLTTIVGAVIKRLEIKKILKGIPKAGAEAGKTPAEVAPHSGPEDKSEKRPSTAEAFRSPKGAGNTIVAIGLSTGGPQALLTMLPMVPADIKVPIVIVQHMPPIFTANLAGSLDSRCGFPVKEAENGEPLRNGTAYIAPGGKQMRIVLGTDAASKIIRVTDDPPENHCKPSADYLFRSVAHLYYGKATGVIMTGMGNDGALGLDAMKRAGAVIIAQDEKTCIVYGMPKAAVDAGIVDAVLPLDRIAGAIASSVR